MRLALSSSLKRLACEIVVLAILMSLIPSCMKMADPFWKNLAGEYFDRAEFCRREGFDDLALRYEYRGILCKFGQASTPDREKEVYNALMIEELVRIERIERARRLPEPEPEQSPEWSSQ